MRQLKLFIVRPSEGKRVVDLPLYTETALTYYRPIRKCQVQKT
jgi:hypothetical protein